MDICHMSCIFESISIRYAYRRGITVRLSVGQHFMTYYHSVYEVALLC